MKLYRIGIQVVAVILSLSSSLAALALDEEKMIKGTSFNSGAGRYTVIENLIASPATSHSLPSDRRELPIEGNTLIEKQNQPLSNNNLPQAQVQKDQQNDEIERKGNMIISFRDTAGSGLASPLASQASLSDNLPVVRNENTGILGILLGNINAKLTVGSDPYLIAQEYKIELLGQAPGPRLAFFKVSTDPDNLVATLNALRADKRIERVSIEVLEHPGYAH